VKLSVGAQTDTGLVRQHNEDNLFVAEEEGILLVADGMGGHASGEVASRIAVDVIRNYFNEVKAGRQIQVGLYRDDLSEATNNLGSAVRLANQAIYEAAQGNIVWQGMGTTIAATLIAGARLSIAHVGDSRVYLIRSGSIEQITDDHSLVSEQVKRDLISKEEARQSEMKNILTRAVGVGPEVEVDLEEMSLLDGDMLVLCSDGLTGMVDDEEIMSVVTGSDPAAACEKLISMANENGGRDNITVIVARLERKRGWFASLFGFLQSFRR
jgi:serine/threonine protein phosphatase PrpC